VSLEEEGIAREGKPRVARTAAEARKFSRGSYWAERGVIFGAWGGAGVFSLSFRRGLKDEEVGSFALTFCFVIFCRGLLLCCHPLD
jgi:hypothetical protein